MISFERQKFLIKKFKDRRSLIYQCFLFPSCFDWPNYDFTLLEGSLGNWDIGSVGFVMFSNGPGLFSVFEYRGNRISVLRETFSVWEMCL